YLFDRVGLLTFPQGVDEEAVMEIAVAADADEVEVTDEGIVEVTTAPEVFDAVHDALKSAGLTVEFAEILQRPSSQAVLDDENSEKVMGLIDALDELDDVQEVFTNASLAGDLLSEE
ncbi:MAG TPA: YebC/PmpR family DNA-binding transcriptional regulator, partial [Gammaproteobacteria bacterium]|nr:YebC/PmpR family DNA-binding transcriptional regulator [Gammaproteobacteria bacterium]